jgi:hypothetical protein
MTEGEIEKLVEAAKATAKVIVDYDPGMVCGLPSCAS